jgi:aspartate/methionine/tyrosine aminotransferase
VLQQRIRSRTGNASMRGLKYFNTNDYNIIYDRYFRELIASGQVLADPSGWAHSETEISIETLNVVKPETLADYLIDNRNLVAAQKQTLLSLLKRWDNTEYDFDDVTVVPSISTASLAVLMLLANQRVNTLYFETPGYYVTLDQASSVGMRFRMIPTYRERGYEFDIKTVCKNRRGPIAVWLTQPRFALGQNQKVSQITSILSHLDSRDFLVIDETADQAWPSTLSQFKTSTIDLNIIKIRGYMKPLGLNALRTAFIIHASRWRHAIQELQWTVGAALDYYSLASAVNIASDASLFCAMLNASRNRVERLHRELSALIYDSPLSLSPMENGYLGALILDWGIRSSQKGREHLLEECRSWRMPVTLGSAMLFAREPRLEHIRLNYFMPGRDLEFCAQRIKEFAQS